MKSMTTLLLILTLAASLAGCKAPAHDAEPLNTILLADEQTTFNGETITSDTSSAVYLSRDIIYYEDKEKYESGNLYGEGTESERHTEEEASSHTVINITRPGTYRLTGGGFNGDLPGGGERPADGEHPFDDGTIRETGHAQTDFYMQDKVNAFSGITDTSA